MKKRIGLFLVVCLLTVVPATAQIDFGLKAGVNFTEKLPNISEIKSWHTGWYAGPMVKFIIPGIGLGFEANALYSQSGTNFVDEIYNRNSIELPVYLRYELQLPAVKKFLEPFIAVGPQWGYAFGKKEFGNVKNKEDIKEVTDRIFKFKDSYFSLNVGFGLVLIKHVQLHLNYNIALGQTSEYYHKESSLIDKIEYIKSQSNIWQLSVAYLF
ncbi:MAG: PorT family protein [Bacteroidaceae bacterium]|nr:PorT family protein [Bacteroidaceae bacterium]